MRLSSHLTSTRAVITALLCLGLFVMIGCGPKPKVRPQPPPQPTRPAPEPQKTTLQQAREMVAQKAYGQALALYESLLGQPPSPAELEAVLFESGALHLAMGNPEAARPLYQRLLTERPTSAVAPQAAIHLLTIEQIAGRHESVIQTAAALPLTDYPSETIANIQILVADTYQAMNRFAAAALAYHLAMARFAPPLPADLIEKRTRILEKTTAAQIQAVTRPPIDPDIQADLLLELARAQGGQERFEQAVETLTRFLHTFPDHRLTGEAQALADRYFARTVYDRFTIGCLLPLTGRYRVYGQRALAGIEMAFADFAATSDNRSIRLLIRDTASDPARAEAATAELADEHVAAIIGPMVTSPSAAKIAQAREIPMITMTQKEDIADIGDYVFRHFLTPAMQVQALVSHAVKQLGTSRFAILYPDEKYGRKFMNLFWDQVISAGGQVVGAETYNPRHTDFADPIKKLAGLYYPIPADLLPAEPVDLNLLAAEPEMGEPAAAASEPEDTEPEPIIDFEVLFIPDAPNKAGLIAPQLAYYDVKGVTLMGTNLWHSPQMIEMGGRYLQGALVPDSFFADSTTPAVQQFVRRFRQIHGEPPDFVTAVAYDSAQLLLKMVAEPHIRYQAMLRDALLKTRNHPGITGNTSFLPNGDVHKDLTILKIRGKRFRQVKPPALPSTPIPNPRRRPTAPVQTQP